MSHCPRCPHCHYAPGRRDRAGYCSWDCHDHDYPGSLGSTPAGRLADAADWRRAARVA